MRQEFKSFVKTLTNKNCRYK